MSFLTIRGTRPEAHAASRSYVLQQTTQSFLATHNSVVPARSSIRQGKQQSVLLALVIALLVVMGQVLLQGSAQRPLPEQDELRQAFLFHRSHPAFCIGVQIRAPSCMALVDRTASSADDPCVCTPMGEPLSCCVRIAMHPRGPASHRYSVTSRLQSQRTRSRDPQTGLGTLCTNSLAARWVAGVVNANETGPWRGARRARWWG
jgi:hypothetical protein